MANAGIKNRLFSLSPHIEMILRRVFWSNVQALSRYKRASSGTKSSELDYSAVMKLLRDWGVEEGDLLVVHSSYGALKGRGKTANEVLDFLFGLVGKAGTLAMPAIPKFDNDPPYENYLTVEPCEDDTFEYDVQKSKVTTGVLPLMLHKRPGSKRSRFPINSLVASGPLALELFANELDAANPLACGKGSAWHKISLWNGKILGLGTDLTHSLTSIHVSEDAYEDEWPVADWYRLKKFKIRDEHFEREINIRERRPKWGALHYGERTLCKDLMREGILKSSTEFGILIEMLDAAELDQFLRAKQERFPGYPYFWVRSHIHKSA